MDFQTFEKLQKCHHLNFCQNQRVIIPKSKYEGTRTNSCTETCTVHKCVFGLATQGGLKY